MFSKIKTLFGRTADVVIANAGVATDWSLLAEDNESTWWSNFVSISASHTTAADQYSRKSTFVV